MLLSPHMARRGNWSEFSLFTKDTHTPRILSGFCRESNTEKKTISPPDLNLVWAAVSISVARVSSVVSPVWSEQFKRPGTVCLGSQLVLSSAAFLSFLTTLKKKRQRADWCLCLFLHASLRSLRDLQTAELWGGLVGEGGREKGVQGCRRWGSAAYPRLGHQSRSVACRCTF